MRKTFYNTYNLKFAGSRRMSMYFFRLHNLRRAEERKKKKQQQQRRRKGGCNRYAHAALTLAPSRLFERPPLTPSDSLDEVALQIPRCSAYVNKYISLLYYWCLCVELRRNVRGGRVHGLSHLSSS